MKVVYATQPLPQSITRSIFLAGPTPRGPEAESWRPHAISLLQEIGFDGTVFVPESEDGIWRQSYTDQVEWEELCLNAADCIVFWIPFLRENCGFHPIDFIIFLLLTRIFIFIVGLFF